MNEIMLRRSIRSFKPMPVEKEKIESLLRAGMQAPSAVNVQPWEFIVVTDKDRRSAIAKASPFALSCNEAPVVILTLARLPVEGDAWWVQDMAACTQNILLQAVSEGLAACWCGMYPHPSRVKTLRELFELPDSMMPFSVIAVGYSDRPNHFKDRYQPERVHYEVF